MKKRGQGFTLIEVAIFLAVTGALFAAVTIGVQNSIYQQRYNDTVQSFVDFLGNLYSEVVNVQSLGNGRSGEAIYGKLVNFGEDDSTAEKQVIHTYDVIAKAVNTWDNGASNVRSTLDLLSGKYGDMGTNVVRLNEESKQYEPVGVIEDYTPRWAAKIEKIDKHEDFVGSLLIVRNAQTGIVQTYVYIPAEGEKPINVQKAIEEQMGVLNIFKPNEDSENILEKFISRQVDFCVNPNGNEDSNTRMDVRIVKGAHDESGIETISFDSADSKCLKF